MGGPWEELTETREHPPPMSETSMVGPLGGDTEGPGVLTSMQKVPMTGPLGGSAGGPRVLTIKAKNVDGGPHGGRCRRSGSAHHQN
jgi:hypothetical protein